ILADGILEYRNTWEHPQLENGAIFQPVLGHKIATIGRSQSRWLESWGNAGKCEVVGLPRLDRHCGLPRRQRKPTEPFRILVNTAITPYFTEAHRQKMTASLRDLKSFFDSVATINGIKLEPVWRLTKGLDAEIGVSSQASEFSGHEMAVALQQVDAVITTPSTAILEGTYFGLPVAVLDYCNTPQYISTAWRITAQEQIATTLTELISPAEPKLLFQETVLHDSLECDTPAAPRLLRLITGMVEQGLLARATRRPLEFSESILPTRATAIRENRFRLDRLYPTQTPQAADAQVESFSCPPTEVFNRVTALLKQGKLDEAKEFLGRALKLNQWDAGLLRPLAELAGRQGWFAEAADALSKLLQIDPRDTEALLGKAVCSAERGHSVLAGILLNDLIKLDPQNATARACLAALATRNGAKTVGLLQYWIPSITISDPPDGDWSGMPPGPGLRVKVKIECAVNAV
ncbi:MAG TPA: tetratricopeptide repeat protein, partial [Verrucomicrobiae bacterium]|nr:tetratricopeptide repeat protein [Verrucomicrobiae bacterium]